MEEMGKKKRLEEIKNKGGTVKLIFQYPASRRAVIKSGKVLEVYDDCFDINEKYDGKVTYGYSFLEEIKEVFG